MSSEDDSALIRNTFGNYRRRPQVERNLKIISTLDRRSAGRVYQQTDEESSQSEQYGISMEDLISDTASEGAVGKMNGHGRVQGMMANASSYGNIRQGFTMQPSSRTSSYTSVSGSEYDDVLRKKLHTLRDENSRLIGQNHELMNQLENAECVLMSKDNQVKMLSLELEAFKENEPNLEEKLSSFESEITAQDKALRNAEAALHECQRDLSERDTNLRKTREELKQARSELLDEKQQRKRNENQKDEALQNLEELNDQLAEFRNKTKEKLKKHQENEEHLRDSLLHCDKEREELLNQASSLEAELIAVKSEIRRLQDERSIVNLSKSDSDTMNIEFRTQISRQAQKITELEIDMDKKSRDVGHLTRQLETKARECTELQDLSRRQGDRLAQCQRDLDQSHAELKTMESLAQQIHGKALATSMGSDSGLSTTSTVKHHEFRPTMSSSPTRSPTRSVTSHADALSSSQIFNEDGDLNLSMNSSSGRAIIAELKMKLAMKEAEIQRLQTQRHRDITLENGETQMGGLRNELMAVVEKSKMGERKSQELEEIINRLEEDRGKQASEVLELEGKLSEKETFATSLESRVNQCNSQITDLQKDVYEKCEKVISLEREGRKKDSQIMQLEKQLDEKVAAYKLHANRLTELEQALREKTTELGNIRGQMDDKSEEFQQATSMVEKIKGLHMEHCKELEQQIEMLQQRCEEKNRQLQEMESSMATLQSELSMKTSRIEHLDKALNDCRHELTNKMKEHDQAWHALQMKANEGTAKVSQLESALVVCKEELKLYIDQLDETRDRHERQLDKKNEEVRRLDKLLKQSRHDLNERENQILELQQTLHERQQMLQQSTGRIGDLEDCQTQLQQQVSQLEKELNKSTSTAMQESENMEKKLHQACLDLEQRTGQVEELSMTLNEMQTDLQKSSTQINELEKQLQLTHNDNDSKTKHLAQIDALLQDTKVQLEQKTLRVKELEERLHHMEEELHLHQKRSTQLDGEMRRAGGDLQEAMQQLEEYQRLLQNSKMDIERKDDKISELDQNLKEANTELMNRDRELTDLDHALKERQWELKQRAAQVTQLDMTMKEHRSEMEQKVMKLEGQLNKSQLELKERAKQIADLDDKLQQQRDKEKEKSLQMQQLEQNIQRHKNELSQKVNKISDLERKIQELNSKVDSQREDELEQCQQLRLTREQMQRQHLELADLKKQLSQANREHDRVARELEETIQICRSKETDCTKMAEELGISRAREASAESRFMAELQHLKHQHELDIKHKEVEVSSLQESHASLVASKNSTETNHRLQLQQYEEKEKHMKQHVETVDDKITSLENELRARQEVIDAANEAIVIKEAEVARLNAKISGYERATFGVRNREWAPPSSSATNQPFLGVGSSSRQGMPQLLPALGPMLPIKGSPSTNLRRSASEFSLAEQSNLNLSGVEEFQSDAGSVNMTRDFLKPPHTYSRFPVSHGRAGDLVVPKQSHAQGWASDGTDNPFQDPLQRSPDEFQTGAGPERFQSHPGTFQSLLDQANQEMTSSVSNTPSKMKYSPPEVPTLTGARGTYSQGRAPYVSYSMPSSPAKSLPLPRVSPPDSMSRPMYRSGLYRASSQPQLNRDDLSTQDTGYSSGAGYASSVTGYGSSGGTNTASSPVKTQREQFEQKKPLMTPSFLKTPSPATNMTPEEYMSHLQERLRVNEERRRRIDEQLQTVRDTAKEAHQNGAYL